MSARSDLEVALEAAAAGAAELRARYRVSGVRESARSKSVRRDLVTDADGASEAAILDVLRARRPHDAVVAEEGSPGAARPARYWCVDPLDGTLNFAHGIPVFCVSVALVVDGVARVGVLDAPLLGELHETDGAEARLNGERVQVSATDDLRDAIVATGFAYDRENLPDDNTASFRNVLMACRCVRRCGSAALDLAWVACGRFDAYWERWVNAWDMAAGAALVRAAGGRVTDMAGGDRFLAAGHVAASNGALHGALLPLLTRPV